MIGAATRYVAALLAAGIVVGCGSSTPTAQSSGGGVAGTPSATVTSPPAATTLPTPAPEKGWAVHIVSALDDLARLSPTSDGVSGWAVTESRWTIDNVGAGSGAFGDYSLAMLDLLQAIDAEDGIPVAVDALLGLRAGIAAYAPGLVPAEAPAKQIVVEGFGFTYFGGDTKYVQYGVVLRNPNVVDWLASDVQINITFFDADGGVIGSEDEYISAAPPGNADEPKGRRFAVGDVSFVDGKVVKMTVTATADLEATDGSSYGNAVFTKVRTTSDAYGTTTRGLVSSTYAEALEDVAIVAIYRNAAGKILGGDFDYVDRLPTAGTVSFEINTLDKIPRVDKVELFANP